MRDSTPTFTPEDKAFLAAIRDDIAARPGFYRAGIDYLSRRFSADALHAADMKTWAEFKEHPTEIASKRAIAQQMTCGIADAGEREARFQEVLASITAAPDKDKGYWLSNCLIHAFSTLLHEGLDTPDDDLNAYDLEKTKAVLGLTWLLTDKNANLHPLGEAFGPWLAGQHEYAELPPNDEFALQIAAKGRAMARVATLDELNGECRARWMALVRQAWQVVLGHPSKPVPTGNRGDGSAEAVPVERIRQLPIPDEFKPVLIEVAAYVLAHPERFRAAADRINADLAAKAKPDADGDAKPPVFWLTYVVPDAAREVPPALTGPDYELWSHRLMLLATVATYPGDLSRFGTCGAIAWDHGTVYDTLKGNPKADDEADRQDMQIPLPVPGRAWILFNLDGTLREEMQDKAGEHVVQHHNRIIDGKHVPVAVERTPWKLRGVLGKLVDQLSPILDELRKVDGRQKAVDKGARILDRAHREKCFRDLSAAVERGDVSAALGVFADDVEHFATHLKHAVFAFMGDGEHAQSNRRMCAKGSPLRPHFGNDFIGTDEVYAMLELHPGPEQAMQFARRVNELNEATIALADLCRSYEGPGGTSIPLETMLVIDEARKNVKGHALGLASDMRVWAGRLGAGRVQAKTGIAEAPPAPASAAPTNPQPPVDGNAVVAMVADRAGTEPRLLWLKMYLDGNANATLRQIEKAAKQANHHLPKSSINDILRREKWIGHPPRGKQGKTSIMDPDVIAESMSEQNTRRSF